MTRTLWLVNLVLTAVVVLLLVALADSLVNNGPSVPDPHSVVPSPAPEAQGRGSEVPPAAVRPTVPPVSDYAIVVQKDVFKAAVVEPAAPATVRKPSPPPTPLPALIGTVFVGDERKAILRDGKRTEIFEVGEEVAGGKLLRIETDRVVFQRGGASVEVLLKSSIQSVSPPGPAGSAAPPAESGAASESPTPLTAPGPAAPPSAPQSQMTEQAAPTQPESVTVEERVQNIRKTLQNRRRYSPAR
jgi:type II secretory pathway component PulC